MKIDIDKVKKNKKRKTAMLTARVRPETKEFFQKLDLDKLKEELEKR